MPRFAVPTTPWPPEPPAFDPSTIEPQGLPPARQAPPETPRPPPAPGAFPGAIRPDDRPVPVGNRRADPVFAAPPVDPRRLRALPPEPDLTAAPPRAPAPPVAAPSMAAAALPEADAPPPARPVRARRPLPVRRLAIAGGVLGLVVLGIGWLLSGPAPAPAPDAAATTATATETPAAAPQVPGIQVSTVWTRIPVAIVDGSGGRVTSDAPFRLRVDGVVYTLSGEAMPIIPVEPDSRVEARAVSGTVTLTVTP